MAKILAFVGLAFIVLLLWLAELFQFVEIFEAVGHYWQRRRLKKEAKPINPAH